MIIKRRIVCKQNAIAHKRNEAAQSLFRFIQLLMKSLFYNRIHHISQSFGYWFICFYMNRELRNATPLTYLFSRNLYNIIVENTQSCCFSIENNNILFLINLEKTL